MRILKSLNVPFKRTIRIGLWGGEEEGLLGSIDYVKKHYADRADMKLKPEFGKLDVYFNSDTGTGKFRGISVGGNDEVLPIFQAWAKPLRDLGFQVVLGASSAPLTAPGGTDHTSFDYAGLPGFGFLQEPMEYQTRTHHSNMDTYDRVQKGDIMQSAVIMAVFAYHAAMRDQMIPRKEIPAPKAWRAE
jgi:Zn-dependent M28 family amino/carboxypeptidase